MSNSDIADRNATTTAGTLGTFAGVFTPSVLTILGIILFLRLGYVVGEAGLARALVIIVCANTISILTSLSLSAIATNLKVKGGGDYYVISRTLGSEFGGALGLVLFMAQSVSIAFYCIGFGEALTVIVPAEWALSPRLAAALAVSALFILAWLGADWATRFQYGVMALLIAALISFYAGAFSQWDASQVVLDWSAPAGAQLFWQFAADPDLRAQVRTVLTYPQYWSYRLTGQLANEVTSLGCHTDLWNPRARGFSSLVEKLGLEDRMAPVAEAADCTGTLLPEIATRTGLPEGLTVACGIHDSNASLYPHLLRRSPPFSVVSTGTWVIALSLGGREVQLDPARDTLINVNAFGDPVPSARFMGGREFDLVMNGRPGKATDVETARVLEENILLLPAVEPRSGPFQGRQSRWTVDEASLTDGERFAAVSFYLALMTAECLAITGADGPTLVEGPFARNSLYAQMLEAATGRPVIASEGSATGTSIGAALLVAGDVAGAQEVATDKKKASSDSAMAAFAERWRKAVGPG